MELVSSNSDREVRRDRALGQLRWAMRELTANLMRITRGAGKGYLVGEQMVAALNLYQAYREAADCYPADYELREMLSLIDRDEDGLPIMRREEWDYGIRTIVKGSLQLAASALLHQIPQRSAGESELVEGVTTIEALRARNLREWQESQRRVVAPRKKKASPRKPAAKRSPSPA